MKLPWVSRERLEDAQRQLAESETERKRLLELLLVKPPVASISRGTQEMKSEKPAETRGPTSYTTPFDQIERRFSEAFKAGEIIPQKFKARIN